LQFQVVPRLVSAVTMLTPDREELYALRFHGPIVTWSRAGCKRDRRAAPLATEPLWGYSDGDDGTPSRWLTAL
jgi:hypothetical protein